MIGEDQALERPRGRRRDLLVDLAHVDLDAAAEAEEEQVDLAADLHPHPAVVVARADLDVHLRADADRHGPQHQLAREAPAPDEHEGVRADADDRRSREIEADDDGPERGADAEPEADGEAREIEGGDAAEVRHAVAADHQERPSADVERAGQHERLDRPGAASVDAVGTEVDEPVAAAGREARPERNRDLHQVRDREVRAQPDQDARSVDRERAEQAEAGRGIILVRFDVREPQA